MGGPSVGRRVPERAEGPTARQAHERGNAPALRSLPKVAGPEAVDSDHQHPAGRAEVVEIDRHRGRRGGRLGPQREGDREGQDRGQDREGRRRRPRVPGKEEEVQADGEQEARRSRDRDRREREPAQGVDGNRVPVAQEVVPVEDGAHRQDQEHERGEEGAAVDHRAQGAGPPPHRPGQGGDDQQRHRPDRGPGEEQADREGQGLPEEHQRRVQIESEETQAGGPDRGRQDRTRHHATDHRPTA